MKPIASTFALLAIILAGHTVSQAQDPLPSWNDGPAKQAIVDFVRETTEKGAQSLYRPRNESPPSTRTAHCGSRPRCIPK